MAEKIRKLEIEVKQKENRINYLLANPYSISNINTEIEDRLSRPILGGYPKTSPKQTVVGKDSSNPLIAATLPKSGRIAREVADNTSLSPSQTAEGKDKSSPFMVDTLPKSIVRMEDRETKKKNIRRILPKTLTIGGKNKGKKEERNKKLDNLVDMLITSFVQQKDKNQDYCNQVQDKEKNLISTSSSRQLIPKKTDTEQSTDPSPEQSEDGNDIFPMSFDSIALHNLDT